MGKGAWRWVEVRAHVKSCVPASGSQGTKSQCKDDNKTQSIYMGESSRGPPPVMGGFGASMTPPRGDLRPCAR